MFHYQFFSDILHVPVKELRVSDFDFPKYQSSLIAHQYFLPVFLINAESVLWRESYFISKLILYMIPNLGWL
ncbi:TPA: hypothetical protein ACJ6XF_002864 [Legionella pneumophila]